MGIEVGQTVAIGSIAAGNNNIGDVDVAGTVASGAADSGNPVKTGGKHNTTKPTFTDGQRGDTQIDTRGNTQVVLYANDSVSAINATTTTTDGFSTAATALLERALGYLFNGTGWDRRRGNVNETILTSAARTASVDSADFTNYNGRGLHLVIDVTAVAATPSVVFTIQGRDALSGKYYTILASAAITGTGTTVLKVNPSLTAAANLVANDILPRTWRVSAVHGDADSITYSVGASVIL